MISVNFTTKAIILRQLSVDFFFLRSNSLALLKNCIGSPNILMTFLSAVGNGEM